MATRRNALEFGRFRVKVGWSVELGASEETVTIAAINTLGAPAAGIPARDALTPVLAANADAIREANLAAARAANRDEDVEYPLELLAGKLEADLKQSVENFSTPGNAPSTIATKGFDDPLVGPESDGGRLVAEAAAAVTKR
jgi:hypothetical protein